MRRIVASIFFVTLAAFAQTAAPTTTFEVASIKLSRPGTRGGSMEFPPGGERFTATNMPFGAFVLIAYDITVRQLSGPGEFLSQQYDIQAKAEHAVKRDEMLRMLRALLADRFKLVVRQETKEAPVFALSVGKGGPKLRLSSLPEGESGSPRTPSRAGGTELKSGHLVFRDESMADFAWALSRMGGIGDLIVVDQTGLEGRYDFELVFERDNVPMAGGGEPAARPEAPALFAALQEQLGLKVESKKAMIEFLTIEHVERPSEN
jgi:bla regulator protein blaR1